MKHLACVQEPRAFVSGYVRLLLLPGTLTASHGNSGLHVCILTNTHAGARAVYNILSVCVFPWFVSLLFHCLFS